MASSNEMADLSGVRLLLFRIADLVCAAEVEAVREILPRSTATRIPGAAGAVDGLINVRGELVTLVDARRVLERDGSAGGATLLVDVGARAAGFAVDEVLDLITVSSDALAPRDALPGLDPRVVRAVGRHDAAAFVLLDFEALLGPILTA